MDGTGVAIGVISDSVNQYDNPNVAGVGLAESVATGDLPSNVTVVQDGAAGSSDEGRAMLEQIYDIAPGAQLLFATGADPNAPGEIGFAKNIRALAQSGAQIISDDLKYPGEPFFQDGIVAQAVTDVVTNSNVTYFTSAGNQSDGGYQSEFRGVTTTVTGVPGTPGGAAGTMGRFMNFNPDPTSAPVTNLPITVTQAGLFVSFQWDNPFYVANGVTSDLDIFVVDSNNAIVSQATTNNIAQNMPLEFLALPNPGNYSIVIRVSPSSPDPGRVVFQAPAGNGLQVSKQFGAAGGTTYPTTIGHRNSTDAITTGAVPWWVSPAFGQNFNPLVTEQYSSYGPGTKTFLPDGTRIAAVNVRKPDVSGSDANNTSFFIPGFDIDTSNPPPNTGPATATNLDTDTLPNFFGTSSASPNLAAVAALMKQIAPQARAADIKSAMISSALPVNGAVPNTWNVQGGYGLVRADDAMNAIDILRVVTTTPMNGQTPTTTPSSVVVTFNRPINPASVQASDLIFTQVPAGVNLTVGTPVFINATTVAFPLSITGAKGNGNYAFRIPAGAITSLDNKSLAAYSSTFTLNDTTAPRVTNTIFTRRIVVIQFSEAMRPSTINRSNITLVRTGGVGVFGRPEGVVLNNDPRLQVYYDSIKNYAVIDLSGLSQSELPSDRYALVINDQVTDLVGNALDGEFNGPPPSGVNAVFPSGNGVAGGTFIQDLPNVTLQAPQIETFGLDQSRGSDTGIPNDQNTKVQQPFFVGTVSNAFPGTINGLTVLVQFDGLHNGTFDLRVGPGGLGYSGSYDVLTTTDANGQFRFQAPQALANGFQKVKIVVVGESTNPPLPGLASEQVNSFRVDTTLPNIYSASLTPGGTPLADLTKLPNLPSLSLNVYDVVLPTDTGAAQAVPPQLSLPALDPSTANNISNYSLINLGPDNQLGTADDQDLSSFIIGANFVSTSNRVVPSDPYLGRIDLKFAPGLIAGTYLVVARTPQPGYVGITDAAGNPLDAIPSMPGNQNFALKLIIQPEAAYITSFQAISRDASNNTVVTGPRGYYELPVLGQTPRADAPPTQFNIDFSNPLPDRDYSNIVQLIRSADGPSSIPDGDFGVDNTFPVGALGFSRITGLKIVRKNSIPGAQFGDPGFMNRLEITLPAGTTLPADHYRLYIPNTGANAIFDLYGNQLDGEFLGNATGTGGFEDLLPTGQYRPGLTGDGVAGGAFETGFVVVPNGNIIYARPDYFDDPFLTSDDPDGSRAKPYPTLAPEATTNGLNGGNLNSVVNFGTGFNNAYDRNGNGHFDRSALYAAELASARGPVVVVALPGAQKQDLNTGATIQQPFVLQAPGGGTGLVQNDASVSVPFNTMLVFDAGSALKLQNASIYVQNQGSALQVRGGPNQIQRVNFTSYFDDTIGGDTNGDGAPGGSGFAPRGGDWGGIIFRNYDQRNRTNVDPFPVDGRLQGPNGQDARSGADDAMSIINFAQFRYGGGPVPRTSGRSNGPVTLFNSRPAVTNTRISDSGVKPDEAGSITQPIPATGTIGAITADFDSFREDVLSRGPLLRRVDVVNNSINGIYIRAELSSGQVLQTNAIAYPDNPLSEGGSRNFTFDDPLPHTMTTRMVIGQQEMVTTGGQTRSVTNRVYIQPGMMFKMPNGTAIDVVTPGASYNIGDRTYIKQFDANANFGPSDPGFRPNTVSDAKVLFTSFYDDTATTVYRDPNTGAVTTIVPPIDTDNGGNFSQPSPTSVPPLARWGGTSIISGGIAVIDEAQFRYGGGSVNTPSGTIGQRDLLAFQGAGGQSAFGTTFGAMGTRVSVTNNDFYNNLQAPMSITPDGLLAADPQKPLRSGNPFFRGNVMLRNEINGLEVLPGAARLRRLRAQPARRFGLGRHRPDLRATRDDPPRRCQLRGVPDPGPEPVPGRAQAVPDSDDPELLAGYPAGGWLTDRPSG